MPGALYELASVDIRQINRRQSLLVDALKVEVGCLTVMWYSPCHLGNKSSSRHT